MKEKLDKDTAKELLTVLSYCDDSFINKIPNNIIKDLSDIAALSNKEFFIDGNKDLLSQDLSDECLKYLSYLYLEYM